MKKVVGEYEELAEKVPARQLYSRILQPAPDYENISGVRKVLSDLH